MMRLMTTSNYSVQSSLGVFVKDKIKVRSWHRESMSTVTRGLITMETWFEGVMPLNMIVTGGAVSIVQLVIRGGRTGLMDLSASGIFARLATRDVRGIK